MGHASSGSSSGRSPIAWKGDAFPSSVRQGSCLASAASCQLPRVSCLPATWSALRRGTRPRATRGAGELLRMERASARHATEGSARVRGAAAHGARFGAARDRGQGAGQGSCCAWSGTRPRAGRGEASCCAWSALWRGTRPRAGRGDRGAAAPGGLYGAARDRGQGAGQGSRCAWSALLARGGELLRMERASARHATEGKARALKHPCH